MSIYRWQNLGILTSGGANEGVLSSKKLLNKALGIGSANTELCFGTHIWETVKYTTVKPVPVSLQINRAMEGETNHTSLRKSEKETNGEERTKVRALLQEQAPQQTEKG